MQRIAFSTRFESAWSARPASATAPAGGLDLELELDAERLGLMAVAGERVACDLAEVDRDEGDVERASAQPREVEQVSNQALQPLRLPFDHLPGALRRDDAVAEPFCVTSDRRQGRLQLVADGEQEGALRVLSAVELFRELVEGRRQLSELRRPFHREQVGALSLGQTAARRRNSRDRAGDGAREEERRHRCQKRSEERGEGEADEEGRPVGGLAVGGAEQHDRVAAAEAGCVSERLATDLDGAVGAPCSSQPSRG